MACLIHAKSSRSIKVTNFEFEALDRQDMEARESAAAYFELPQPSRAGWIDVSNEKLY